MVKAKDELILELFYNNPTKHWHFEELIKKAKISRPQLNNWLKKFLKEKLIKKPKPKDKMPYYVANYENPDYQNKKRLFILNKLNDSGFLKHLSELPKAKTIILFGSLSRWDWYKDSDIDLFILGNSEGLKEGEFSKKLHRDIQIFSYKTKRELEKLNQGLLKNIIGGFKIKGNLDFLEVKPNV